MCVFNLVPVDYVQELYDPTAFYSRVVFAYTVLTVSGEERSASE